MLSETIKEAKRSDDNNKTVRRLSQELLLNNSSAMHLSSLGTAESSDSQERKGMTLDERIEDVINGVRNSGGSESG